MARKRKRRTLNVIEFEVLPGGGLELIGSSNIVLKGKFDPAWHKLPRPIDEEDGHRRFFLTLEMQEERWLVEGFGRNQTSQLVSTETLYRSFWLEIGDPWLRRIESAWRLFERSEDAQAQLALERLHTGWNLVYTLIAAEAYRFWWLKGLSAKRPTDRDLAARVSGLEQRGPSAEVPAEDFEVADRMLADLQAQIGVLLGAAPG